MKDIFQSIFARAVTLTDASGSRETRAFLEPLSAVRPEAPEITELGVVDGRRWRVILPAMALQGEVTLSADGKHYRLLRYENIGNEHHMEALVCAQEVGEGC